MSAALGVQLFSFKRRILFFLAFIVATSILPVEAVQVNQAGDAIGTSPPTYTFRTALQTSNAGGLSATFSNTLGKNMNNQSADISTPASPPGQGNILINVAPFMPSLDLSNLTTGGFTVNGGSAFGIIGLGGLTITNTAATLPANFGSLYLKNMLNTYAGGTTITGGNVYLNNTSLLGNPGGFLSSFVAGGNLYLQNGSSLAGGGIPTNVSSGIFSMDGGSIVATDLNLYQGGAGTGTFMSGVGGGTVQGILFLGPLHQAAVSPTMIPITGNSADGIFLSLGGTALNVTGNLTSLLGNSCPLFRTPSGFIANTPYSSMAFNGVTNTFVYTANYTPSSPSAPTAISLQFASPASAIINTAGDSSPPVAPSYNFRSALGTGQNVGFSNSPLTDMNGQSANLSLPLGQGTGVPVGSVTSYKIILDISNLTTGGFTVDGGATALLGLVDAPGSPGRALAIMSGSPGGTLYLNNMNNTYTGGTQLYGGNVYLNNTSLPAGTQVGGGNLYLQNSSTVGGGGAHPTAVYSGIFSIDSVSTVTTDLDLYQTGTGTGTFMSGVGGGTVQGSLFLGPYHQVAASPTMTPITVNGGSGITFSPSGTALNVTGNLASLLGSSSFPILTTPLGTISGGPYTSTAFNNIITSTIYRVLYTASSTSLQFASLASAIINTAGDSSPPVAPSYNFRSALESGASTVGFSNSPLTDMNGQSADLSAAASGQGTNVTLGSAGSSSVILDISNLNEVGGGFTVDGGIGTFLGLVDSIVGISTLAIISTGGTPGALYLNNMNNTYTGGTQLFSGSVYLSNTSLPDGTQVGGGNLYLQSGSTVGTTQLGAPTIAVSSGIFSIDSGSTVNTDLDLYQAGTGTGTFMSGAGGGTIQGSLYLGPYHQAAVAPTMTPVAVNGQYGITLNSTALNVTGMLSSLQGLGPFPILTTSLGSISGGPYISTAFNGLPTSALYTVQYLSNAINLTFAAAANAIINTAGDGATPLPPSYNFRSALGSGDNVGFSSSPNMNGQLAYLSLPVGQGTNVTIGSASISSIILDLSNLNTGGFTVDGGGTLGLADGSGGPGSLSIVSTTGGVGTLYLNNMINTYSGGTTLHNGNIYLNATSLPDGTVVGGGALYLTNGSTVGTLTGLATNVLGGIFSIDSGSTVNTNLDLYQGGTGTGTFMSGVGGGTIGGSLNLGPLHQAAVAPTMTPVAVAVNTILNSTALNVTGTISSLLGLPSFPILTAGTVTSWPYASTAFNGLTTTTLYTVSYLPLGAPTSINLKFALPATVFINTAGDGATPTPPAYNFRSALESGANVGFSPVTDMNGQSADLSTTNVTVGSATSTNIILDISNLTTGGFTVDGGGTLGLMDGGAASTLAIISTGGTPGTLYLNNMVNTYTGGTELHSGNVYLSNTTLPDGTQVGGGNLYLTKSSTVGTVKGVATTVSGGIFSIDSGSKVNTDLDLSQSGAGTGTFISGVGGGEIFGSLLLGPTHQAMVGLNTVPIVVRGLQGVDLTNGSVGTAIDVYLTGGQSLSNLKGKAVPILTAPQGVTGKYTSTSLAGTPTTTLYTVDYTDGITLEFGSAFIPLTGAYPEGPTTQNSNGYNTAVYLDFLEPTATGDLLSVIDVLEGMLASGALTDTQLALAQINPSSLAAQGWAASFYAQLITEFGAPQVQLWLSEGGGAPVSTSLAMVDSGRLAAFGKLVTHQTMNLNSASNICNNPRKTPLRKGVVTKESFFTNSGTEVNRHPLTAGRVQMGKANVWVQPYGQVVNQKGNGNGNPGVHNQTGGFSLGADYEIAKNTLVGVLGGAATTSFTWGQGRGNGGMNGGYGGLYGAWKDEDGFYISGQTIFGGNRFTTNRNINFSTINRTATGKHNAFQFSGDLEMGYTLPIYDWFTCQPFILADYMVMREAGYVETGAQSLNMAINAKTSQFLQAEIGAMVYKVFAVDDVLLRPMAELGWMQQRALGSTTNVNGALAGQPGALAVTGVSKIYNQIAPGVGLIAQFVNGLYVSGNVYGEFGGGLNIGEALIRVGYEF